MRLSTSTNIMDRVFGIRGAISLNECIKKCSKAGYRVLDMNFCHVSGKNEYLVRDDWESWIDNLADKAKEYGIEFSQAHNIIYNICDRSVSDREWLEELTRRTFICSGKLGVKWIVIHAGTSSGKVYSASESKRMNIENIKDYANLAQKFNMGIAIENMFDYDGRIFTSSTEELIDLVDSINEPNIGVCWDFGHANLTKEDQCESLKQIGKRLRATHVNDNNGSKDEHLAPFFGNIDWNSIMKTLSDIGYDGDFTYEIQGFSDNLPKDARESMLNLTVDIGKYLINLAKDDKN